MAKVSKRYAAAKDQIDRSKVYTVEEAVDLAKKASSAKFDETVEVSFNLNVDPRHADQRDPRRNGSPERNWQIPGRCCCLLKATKQKKLRMPVRIL